MSANHIINRTNHTFTNTSQTFTSANHRFMTSITNLQEKNLKSFSTNHKFRSTNLQPLLKLIHSLPAGGRNLPNCCSPTTFNWNKEEGDKKTKIKNKHACVQNNNSAKIRSMVSLPDLYYQPISSPQPEIHKADCDSWKQPRWLISIINYKYSRSTKLNCVKG